MRPGEIQPVVFRIQDLERIKGEVASLKNGYDDRDRLHRRGRETR